MKIIIDIETCKECIFFSEERMYTADSFEEPYDWFCKKADNRKIRGYVEWHEEKKVPIPDWCPIKYEEPGEPSDEKIAEIASTYHDREVLSCTCSPDQKCGCCKIKTITTTCIEHDSLDFSKDLRVCFECYAKIANYWKANKPRKISPV